MLGGDDELRACLVSQVFAMLDLSPYALTLRAQFSSCLQCSPKLKNRNSLLTIYSAKQILYE